MPFNRPTIPNLLGRCRSDLEVKLPGADAKLRRKNLGAIAGLVAATAHGLYGAIEWVSRQILPFDAESEELDRHAAFWLNQPRKAAISAVGQWIASGGDGVIVPAGTELVRADGVLFTTDVEVSVVAGTATVAITAVEPGAAGNTEAGAALIPSLPIAGISGGVVAAGGLTGASETEDDEALRARVLARPKQPPHGGADFDYVTWALEIPGVTRAWVYPRQLGIGTVTVRFVRDNDASVIPDEAEVTVVQDYIDARRPVTADVYVVAPIGDPLVFDFAAIVPDTEEIRAAVTASLTDLVDREAVPGGTILISQIRAAVSAAPGVTDYTLTSPAANVVSATGHMTVMGEITWP